MRTHSGDNGLTESFGGGRISKAAPSVQVLGDLDELNAFLGAAILTLPDSCADIKSRLIATQQFLFVIGGAFYTGSVGSDSAKVVEATLALGSESDALQSAASPIFSFEPPGGSAASVALNIARTVCRRAERSAMAFFENKFPDDIALPDYDSALLAYLNRLSDYLYSAGRTANSRAGAI